MSHFTQVACNVDNMDALKNALTELGFGYVDGPVKITSFGQTRTFDLSITRDGKRLPIGWIRKDNVLKLEGDFWNTGINSVQFGKDVSKLHTKHKTTNWLTRKGYRVSYEKDEAGRMVVVGTKW